MIKNVILSTLAIAVLAGCSGKKDSDKDTSVVEAIPVKVQKLEKENIARTLTTQQIYRQTSKCIMHLQLPDVLKKSM